MQRRDLLKAAISGTAGLALVGVQRALLAGADFESKASQPFLTEHQRKTISSLAELIIPETDTPGAIAAGVPQFIELMLSDWYTAEERQPFMDGLTGLDAVCAIESGQTFADCTVEQQTLALQATEGSDFFKLAKELTVLGYYTSEIGASVELRFIPVPGVYIGDYDYSDNERQWTN